MFCYIYKVLRSVVTVRVGFMYGFITKSSISIIIGKSQIIFTLTSTFCRKFQYVVPKSVEVCHASILQSYEDLKLKIYFQLIYREISRIQFSNDLLV